MTVFSRIDQAAIANAPTSGPAGCGQIGGGRTLVNRARRSDGRDRVTNEAFFVITWRRAVIALAGLDPGVNWAIQQTSACGYWIARSRLLFKRSARQRHWYDQ